MASEKTANSSDLTALAAEVLDLWQEHLAAYATDPAAKAELMRLLEPQRQLFADWAAMMQHGLYGASLGKKSAASAAPMGAATAAAASDDGALRVAQLAHRLAELEKRIAKLESGGGKTAGKTSRRSRHSES